MGVAPQTLNGRCLCGAVTFTITAPFRPIIVCHCRQCGRGTGGTSLDTAVAPDRFHLHSGDDALTWFRSSNTASRGFCKTCGSPMLWKPDSGTHISIQVGCLDPPTGLAIGSHIYVDDKSDYYEIAGDAPCHGQDVSP